MGSQASWPVVLVGLMVIGTAALLVSIWDRFWTDFREAVEGFRGGGDPDGFA
jgi:hypothetical protein